MKKDIHPTYQAVSYHCACGNVIETRSTLKGVVQVEICSGCHPFFTGKQKLIDTAGRIDRFKKKFGTNISSGKKPKKIVKKAEPKSVKDQEPKA